MALTQRIRNIDIIRGIAVLGIFTINATDMAYPQELVLDFHGANPAGGINYWLAVISEVLFAGKMRGLFALLFGVSSVLIVERWRRGTAGLSAAGYYYRRLLWLLLFGIVNAYVLLWWGDVLLKYAVLGLLLYPIRRAPSSALLLGALICLAVLTIPPYTDYREMVSLEHAYLDIQEGEQRVSLSTSADRTFVEDWQDVLAESMPDYEWIEEEIRVKSGSYVEIFNYNSHLALEEQTSIFYAEDVWDMLLYMLLGMLLLRAGFFTGKLSRRVHLIIALSGIGVGLLAHLSLNLGDYAELADPVGSAFYPVLFELGRLPFVMGYLSLMIVLFSGPSLRRLGGWMEAVGRMALSNYLFQSIMGAWVFYGFGLAQFNQLSRLDLALLILLAWVFQTVFSVVWMRYFSVGPVEWLWRSMSCWKLQPLRRKWAV